jgi:hypothetical protein
MPRVDITVVIVNYNVRPFLDHCLQSVLRASAGIDVKVIVVDNASEDGSVEMVKQRYPQVTLISNTENLGFARANNQAFQQAEGEFVLIINPDAFVQQDTLKTLQSRLTSLGDVGAVGPKIILPDGRFEPRSMRGFPTPWAAFSYLSGFSALFPRSRLFSRYLLTYLDPDREQEVDALSGCCMMVRRSLLTDLNGFDGDYFMYGEDLDLCYRIKQLGYRILYDPTTCIVHFKGESTRRSTIDHQFHFQKAMRLFVEKNLAKNVSSLARGIITLGFWFQSAEKRLIALFRLISVPLIDILLLNLFIYTGRWIRFGLPGYEPAVWVVNTIYSLFYLVSGLYFGIYATKKFSGRVSLYSGLLAAVLAAAFTYFFRQWAFSRFVVLWFSAWMLLAIPGWRILFRDFMRRKPSRAARSLIKRKTLIVGTDDLGRRIGHQLVNSPTSELEPVGFIDFSEDGAGQIIAGIPVLGSTAELDRIIGTEGAQEVIFSTAEVPYERIIEIIQSLQHRRLNFKVIPTQDHHGNEEITFLRMELSSISRSRNRSGAVKGITFKK